MNSRFEDNTKDERKNKLLKLKKRLGENEKERDNLIEADVNLRLLKETRLKLERKHLVELIRELEKKGQNEHTTDKRR
jgi:hypothetical protein